MTRAVVYAGAFLLIVSVLLVFARRTLWIEPGLSAEYAQESVRVARIDRPPFSSELTSAPAPVAPSAPFSTTWTGQVFVAREGTFTLGIDADAGTSLFVDGSRLFDNVRFADVPFASATLYLARGPHAIFIAYSHHERVPRLDFTWAREGERLAEVPAAALQPRRAGAIRVALSDLAGRIPVALGWAWASALAAIGLLALVSAGRAARRALARDQLWPSMRWILAASAALNACALWWGLPAEWVPIELSPPYVIQAWSQHFIHGWYDAYPPIHFYVLAAALSPFLTLHAVAGVDVYGAAGQSAMLVVSRLVSVGAGVGILVAIALTGRRMFGARAALFAAGIFALVTPFVFYAKTANADVPYVFWFAVSLYFYVRAVESLGLRDLLLFVLTGMLAIGTKDQAYGLYLLAPFVFVIRLRQSYQASGAPRPLVRAIADPRLLVAAVSTIVLFALCFDVPFNFRGFLDHVRFITGPGSGDYRVFEPTIAGHWALVRLSAYLTGISMGWPLFVLAAAGVAHALMSTECRPRALVLLAPAVGYYLGFINVVLYNYDRFMLPVCVILALFGGLAASAIARRTAGAAALAAVFAYSLLYSATVDVLMIRDARYAARDWMLQHAGADEIVAVTEMPELVPRLDGIRTIGVASPDELSRERPQYVSLNVDYARAATPGTAYAELVQGLRGESAGYRLVAAFRSPSPWPWLPFAHPDLVGARQETQVFSVLRDINPTTEIYQRAPAAPAR